jgi:hypothetical protein
LKQTDDGGLDRSHIVVIRVDSIQRQFAGGWPEFKRSVPDRTLCCDNEIAPVGFMTPADVEAFVRVL